ncbi:hypothetical protein [Lacinutrix chionoecetis]
MQLLDFTYCIREPEFTAYATMGNSQDICIVPNRLEVYKNINNLPAFHVEFIRGMTPFSKPQPYGMLKMQLTSEKISPDMLETVRNEFPEATAYSPDFNSGYLGIYFIAEDKESIVENSQEIVQLHHLPLSRLRVLRRISIDYATLIKDALQSQTLLMKGFGVFSVKGYAPRLNVTLTFNPKTLTTALLSTGGQKDAISQATITEFFKKSITELPFLIQKNKNTDDLLLANCLADWYCQRFCVLTAPEIGKKEVIFALNEDALIAADFTWDLMDDVVVARHTFFDMDLIKEARAIVGSQGLDALVHTTVVKDIPTGFVRVELFHPFFQIPKGIQQLGVKLVAPPNLPHRSQSIHETVFFESDQDKKIITLRFSASESVTYEVIPFAIYKDVTGSKELLGTAFKTSTQELILSKDNYPFWFTSFSCSTNLIKQASLKLTIKNEAQKEPFLEPIVLDINQPATIIAFSKQENLSAFTCEVVAQSLSASEEVKTNISLLSDKKIDLTSFKEYGSHEVHITYASEGEKIIGLDLVPEYSEPNSTTITTIALSPNKTQTWRWFSPSIFKSGFKYRLHKEPLSWSEIQSPFTTTLLLKNKNNSIMNEQQHFEGVRYYPNSSEKGRYNYFPTQAMPQTDGNGDPMISIMGGGNNWFLQVSAKYHVPEEILEALTQGLIQQELIQSSSDLSLAPVEVKNVELVLTSASDKTVLGTSKSSGHYPFTAVFNSSLTEDKQKQVVAAFHGQQDILKVNYYVVLNKTYAVDMTLKGAIHEASASLNTESSREDIKEWVEAQIEHGKIELISHFDDAVPEHLVKEVHEKLLDKVIAEIQMGLDPLEMTPDTSILEVKIQEDVPIAEEFVASTDISTWFKNNPNDHIKIIA